MKTVIYFLCLLIIILSISCKEETTTDNKQAQIDSLKTIISQLKPGLGEFMLQIRYHHDSLGKAILNKDYERAAYETDELKETAEKINQLNITNDKLQKPFALFYEKYLQSPLTSLADAAAKKDDASLKNNFTALTNNCNSCHHENNMAFMKIGQ
ncbi:MAG: cytochrome c [Bacteroidetes bacterium]|nr:cytochrome c [Bacteroidota bacterium]